MMHELISANESPQLIETGERFGPVAATKQTPEPMIRFLAELARRQYARVDRQWVIGRQTFACFPLQFEGWWHYLVCRGCGYTTPEGGERFVLHQLLVQNTNGIPAGPAWVLAQDALWITHWNLAAQWLEPREISSPGLSPRICETWARVTGDAGWAGLAIEAWRKHRPLVLIYPESVDERTLLQMLQEAQSLIDPKSRWRIAIVGSMWHPFKKADRFWLAYGKDSQEAITASRLPNAAVIDLSQKLDLATGVYSEPPRTGSWIPAERPAPRARRSPTLIPVEETAPGQPSELPGGAPLWDDAPRSPEARAGSRHRSFGKERSKGAGWMRWALLGVGGITALALILLLVQATQLTKLLSRATRSNPPASTTDETAPREREPPESRVEPEAQPPPATNPAAPGAAPSPRRPANVAPTSPQADPATGLRRLLAATAAEFPSADPPSPDSTTPAPLFELAGGETLLPHLTFALATHKRFLVFQPTSSGRIWNLAIRGENGQTAASIALEAGNPESAESPEFRWSWIDPPSAGLAGEIQGGQLVVGILGPSASRVEPWYLPLARPAMSEPTQGWTAISEGIIFAPHLSDFWAATPAGGQVVWEVADETLGAPRGEVAGDHWLPPHSPKNPANYYALDAEAFCDRIAAASEGEPALAPEAIEAIVRPRMPVRLTLRLAPPIPFDKDPQKLCVKCSIVLALKGVDGSTASLILQSQARRGRPLSNDENKSALEKSVAEWVCQALGLEDALARQVREDGASLSSLRDPASRATALAARELARLIGETLDRPIDFRVQRQSVLLTETGSRSATICAFQTAGAAAREAAIGNPPSASR